MTSVRRRATHHWLRTNTCTKLARIDRRASIAVIANSARRFARIAANARCRIARPRYMALIQWSTWHLIPSRAKTRLARVRLCARITVIASCAVRSIWIAAHSRKWITNTRDMARIGCRAGHGVRPGTRSRLTRIRLRTTIAVVARGSIGLGRRRANSGTRITRTRIVTLIQRHTRERIAACTNAYLASIRLRARIAVSA